MSIKTWRKQKTAALLSERDRQTRARDTWLRRIKDIDSGLYDMSHMPSKRKYGRRIKKCKEKIEIINEVLRERGMVG